jgi:hypothetical protein
MCPKPLALEVVKRLLRGRVVQRKARDAYQRLPLVFADEQRHILQMLEIKAAEGFPKRRHDPTRWRPPI